MDILKKEKINDKYFGNAEVTFDRRSNSFTLLKAVKFLGTNENIFVCVETTNKKTSERQYEIYEAIQANYTKVLETAFRFLTLDKKYISEKSTSNYKVESITIANFNEDSTESWSLDLINLKDGFSHIVVEFEKLNPVGYSVQA